MIQFSETTNNDDTIFLEYIYGYSYYNGIPYKIDFINQEYKGKIYYTGIGCIQNKHLLTEYEFRRLIHYNKEKLDLYCPYNPTMCLLVNLVNWCGAKFVNDN